MGLKFWGKVLKLLTAKILYCTRIVRQARNLLYDTKKFDAHSLQAYLELIVEIIGKNCVY